MSCTCTAHRCRSHTHVCSESPEERARRRKQRTAVRGHRLQGQWHASQAFPKRVPVVESAHCLTCRKIPSWLKFAPNECRSFWSARCVCPESKGCVFLGTACRPLQGGGDHATAEQQVQAQEQKEAMEQRRGDMLYSIMEPAARTRCEQTPWLA